MVSGDVLSQQTTGEPWLESRGSRLQPAPQEGNAPSWLPATTWPAQRPSGRARARPEPLTHRPSPQLPASTSSSCFAERGFQRREVWKLCSRGPHAIVPGRIVCLAHLEITPDLFQGGDRGSEHLLDHPHPLITGIEPRA